MARIIDAIMRLNDQFTPTLSRINNQMQEHSKQHQRMGKDISSTGNSISNLSKNVALMSAPLMAAAMAGLKLGSDLTNGMAKVSTLVDDNVVDMKKLRTEIVDLSNQTGVAVTDLSAAQYQAISAGVDAAESVGFLGTAVKTAKAGFTDITTAVDGLTTVINAYGLATEDSIKISDQLMVAQNFGKTTINEMTKSLGNVIPIAASLNIKTEELFGSIAVLTRNGIGTSESITGLKAAFSNIVKPTAEATKAAEAMGIQFNASALQSKGLQNFLIDIKEKLVNCAPEYINMINKQAELQTKMQDMKKGSEEYKRLKKESSELAKTIEIMAKATDSPIAGFATMFGSIEALNTILVLSGKGAGDFQKALALMGNSAGQTEEAYEKLQTPSAQTIKAMTQLANAGMELADGLTPLLKTTTVLIKSFAEWLNSLTDGQKEFLTSAARNVVIFVVLTGVLGKTIGVVGKGVTIFGKFSEGIKKAGSVGAFLRKEYSMFFSVMNMLKKAGSGLLKGSQVIFKGIVAGGKMLGSGLQIVFKGLLISIKFLSKGFVDLVRVIIFVSKVLSSSIIQAFRIVAIAARGLFMNPIGLAVMAIIAVIWLLVRNWDKIKESMLGTITQIATGIKQCFGGIIQFITGVFTGNWAMAWEGIKNIFGGAFNALAGLAKLPLNTVIALINAAIGEINTISFTAPEWVPVYGGQTFQPNLPQIPMLYKGTNNWGGGMAMVHDKGAEIIDLPRGSRVYPHDKSLAMARAEGARKSSPSISIAKIADKVVIREDADIQKIAQALAIEIKKASINC